ncbi:MAG: CYTH domain-containing protein [Flavobacterium sp.]
MTEIERKFLVNSSEYKDEAFSKKRISQGYICNDPKRTVRIRIKENQGFITIKGESSESGMSRFEWEKPIPVEEAIELLKLCNSGKIDKTRYEVKSGNHVFEVDEFHSENEGLVIAEIELNSESETFEKPHWLGQEVTTDEKYYNSYLSQKPFKTW